ncbi:acyl-CoA dehydrogenase family protein [Loktanella sp. DJP18]|uniref:acyl-CoA dehydrogenase family protein n=1 Tax=Loktanella sp. DJP18 TaxID=3409788 RepID=UPI003BB77C65
MNFDQTDDRRMLSDSLSRLLTDTCDPRTRNAAAYTAPFHSPDLWTKLVDLGTLYALADPAQGGFGGAGFDIATVFEALGSALCPEPVLPALMAARLLTPAGADLEPLLSGAVTYAMAVGERDGWDLAEIETTARNGTLTGRKSVVYGGHVAETILVVARNGEALSLYEVAAADAHIMPYAMIDGGGAAEVILDAAPARLLIADAAEAVQDALDAGALALSAEALGAMDATLAMLLDYLKQRHQFGRPIGSNQALQHRAVELVTEIAQARSIVILAASRMGTELQSRTVSMCKHLCGRVAQRVAEEAIQMHGGIAMTWEAPVSHYAKRLVMIDAQLGDTDHHIKRVMAALQAV